MLERKQITRCLPTKFEEHVTVHDLPRTGRAQNLLPHDLDFLTFDLIPALAVISPNEIDPDILTK
ncbi:hypothetical protein NQ315_013803 [Exocentrus adspersus]|uniref:Uncharacterized protein n=1 Tax=Exocentrus adspersus TaxID=1586481 RepID=A0AAV8V6E4_9CUCU|nr:hypothetical protein NQ315_013803 [Exocentrus adspersus]